MPATEELIRTPAPGTVLAGKYRVNRVLGSGGMGYVLAATHIQLDEPVAIKLLHSEHLHDSEVIARFLREAKAVRKIRSEHVARVLDVGTLEDGAPYIVMEFLDGSDLDGVLRETGRQPIAKAVDFILQASEALAEAHTQGMVHRDLKPANLFVAKRADGNDLVKVLDFGISKIQAAPNEAALTKAGTMLGSPLYMAPEQIKSFSAVDPRTDIWALTCILHECLVGTPPFDGDSLPELCVKILDEPPPPMRGRRPEISEAFEKVIHRGLAKEPSARYANVAELANALAPFASDFGRQSVATIAGVFTKAGIDVPRLSAPPGATTLSTAGPTPRTRPRTLFDPSLAARRPNPAPVSHVIPQSTQNPSFAAAQSQQNPSTQNPPFAAAQSQQNPSIANPSIANPSTANPSTANPSNPNPPAQRPAVGVTTTGKAWGPPPRTSNPPPTITAPKKKESHSDAITIGIVVAGLIVLGLVGLLVVPAFLARRVTTPTPEVVSASAPSASAPPPAVSAAPPASASAEPAIEPPVVDAGVELAIVDAGAPDAARATPVPVKVDCTHPYDFDSTGRKRWKRECVQ